jgi:hypothetical protein
MGMLGVVGPYTRSAFRKRLGLYSYKIGKKNTHKATGMVPLGIIKSIKKNVKNQYKAKLIIAKMVRESPRLFGKWGHNSFIYDVNKVPMIDIPEIKDFEVLYK